MSPIETAASVYLAHYTFIACGPPQRVYVCGECRLDTTEYHGYALHYDANLDSSDTHCYICHRSYLERLADVRRREQPQNSEEWLMRIAQQCREINAQVAAINHDLALALAARKEVA